MRLSLPPFFGLLLFICFVQVTSPLAASAQTVTNFIQTQPIQGSPFCVGSTVTVPFTTDISFPEGNVFTVQLSSTTGSFATPRSLGTAAGTGAGSIQVTLPTNLTAGTGYRVRVTASQAPNGTTVLDNGSNLTIGVPPATPTITAPDICAGSTLSLTANNVSGATYTWTGPNNFAASGRVVTIPQAETTASGVYTVTLSLNGCSATASKEVTVRPASANAGPDMVTCPGQSVQLTATGGVSYSWAPSATLNDATIANPIATPAATTTYTVTVTNANGCVRTDQVLVTVSPLPTIAIAPATPAVCPGSSVQLTASGAVSYSWSPAIGLDDPTSATPVASPAQTTTYTVTGTSAAGCTNTRTVTVTVKVPPVANAGFDRTVCSGQAVVIGSTTTSSGTYLWEPATGLSSATTKTPTLTLVNNTAQPVSHTYKLTVISNGCVSTDEVVITVSPAVQANAGPDVAICAGGSTQLNATGGTVYRWNPTTNLSDPNSPTPVAFPTATTRYIVTITNAEGCSRNDTVFVNVNPLPVVTVTPAAPSICVGSSVQLQATGAVTYQWSPAAGLSNPAIADPVASPTETTTYTVTGYSATGCASVSKTVTVKVNPYPIANAGPDKVVCSRQSTTIGAPAVSGYTYSWSPALGLSNAKAANPTLTYPGDNLQPITVEYTLTVTANGCSSSDVVQITVNPTAYAGPAVAICQGASTQLQATGGITYSWSPATGLSNPTIANPIASPTATTTYTVTVTNPNGVCSTTSSVRVTVNAPPTVTATASSSTVCAGSPVTLTATGGTSYSWSPATGLSNPTSATPTATPSATTTYTVTATDARGCSNTASVTVNVTTATATIQASGPTTFCPGGSVTLTASPGTAYLWSTGATTPSITVNTEGSYTVRVSNSANCQVTSAPTVVTVSAAPVATIQASGTTALCSGASVTLTASPGSSYLWNTGATTPSITVSTAGSYSVTVTNGSNCQATSTPVVVTSSGGPAVSFAPVGNICKDRSTFALTGGAPAGGTYSGPGVSNNQFSAAVAGVGVHTLTYTYTSPEGCSNTATQTITVENCLSAADELQAASLNVYPNPATSVLTVSVKLLKKENILVRLTDLRGKVVYETISAAPAGDFRQTIPVQTLPAGMYLLQYRAAGASTSRKVVITR